LIKKAALYLLKNIFGKIDKKKRHYTCLNLTIPPTIIVRIDEIKEENEDVSI